MKSKITSKNGKEYLYLSNSNTYFSIDKIYKRTEKYIKFQSNINGGIMIECKLKNNLLHNDDLLDWAYKSSKIVSDDNIKTENCNLIQNKLSFALTKKYYNGELVEDYSVPILIKVNDMIIDCKNILITNVVKHGEYYLSKMSAYDGWFPLYDKHWNKISTYKPKVGYKNHFSLNKRFFDIVTMLN